jgi:hypothetical protein
MRLMFLIVVIKRNSEFQDAITGKKVQILLTFRREILPPSSGKKKKFRIKSQAKIINDELKN